MSNALKTETLMQRPRDSRDLAVLSGVAAALTVSVLAVAVVDAVSAGRLLLSWPGLLLVATAALAGAFASERVSGVIAGLEARCGSLEAGRGRLHEDLRAKNDELLVANVSLAESEERSRALLDATTEGIVMLDLEGRILSFNSSAVAIFGRRSEEVRGESLRAIIPPPYSDYLADELRNADSHTLKRFVGAAREIEGVRRNGKRFPMMMGVTAVTSRGRCAFLAIVQDVTRDREVEAMKSTFVSTVSHEIRTPLTAIVASAKILSRKLSEQPAVTKFASVIVDEGTRLGRLIDSLLNLSELESGLVEWRIEDFAAAELVERGVKAVRDKASARDVEVRANVPELLATVRADADKLVAVLSSLLDNAVKFSSAGGQVSVDVSPGGDNDVRFDVIDSGIGIAAEECRSIFDRFKQGGDVLTSKPSGTGLGLAISREIVEGLGGRIWVQSKVGSGSTFSFTIPSAVVGDHKATSPRHLATADSPTVLVLEANPSVRLATSRLLTSNGMRVIEAATFQEARVAARAHHPALVLLDIMLSGRAWDGFIADLRAAPFLRDTPIVISSMYTLPDDPDRRLRPGADVMLYKTFDEECFISAVQAAGEEGGRHALVISPADETADATVACLERNGYAIVDRVSPGEGVGVARRLKPDLIVVASTPETDDARVIEGLRRDPSTETISMIVRCGLDASAGNVAFYQVRPGERVIATDEYAAGLVRRLRELLGLEDSADAAAREDSKHLAAGRDSAEGVLQ